MYVLTNSRKLRTFHRRSTTQRNDVTALTFPIDFSSPSPQSNVKGRVGSLRARSSHRLVAVMRWVETQVPRQQMSRATQELHPEWPVGVPHS